MSIIKATPAAKRKAFENKVDLSRIIPRPGLDYLTSADILSSKTTPKITNLAKSILNYHQLDMTALDNHIDGKLTKEIALQAVNAVQNEKLKENVALSHRTVSQKPLSGMRRTIAAKMVQSLASAAQYTLFADLNADKVKSLTNEIASAEQALTGKKITVTDVLTKIAATALVKHPLLNSSLINNEIIIHDRINIGLAVALDEGLIVPVIKNAVQKNLLQISADRQSLVDKARKGTLRPDEYTGGTFTISNLGMYPVDYFTPIINLPETAILGIGRMIEKAVPVNGKVAIMPMMGVSLTLDHRVIDGSEGAKFLATLKEMFENPYHICLSWF